MWNLAISGNHATHAHAIHSWAKWKPNMHARGRALAAIFRRRKRHNRKRTGSSRCHGSLFPFMKTMFVSTGTGQRTSTESGKGYTQFLVLVFTSIYILLKSSKAANFMPFSLLLIRFRLPFWRQRPLFNSECSGRKPNGLHLGTCSACCCHLLHCARTGAGMWHQVMSCVVYGQSFFIFLSYLSQVKAKSFWLC